MMRTAFIWALLVITGDSVVSTQNAAGTAADEQAVRELVAQWSAAFNEGQAERIVQLFTTRGDLVTTGGRVVPHADLQTWLPGEFESPEGPRTLQLSVTFVRFLASDIGLLDGTWTEMSPGPHGREMPPLRLGFSAVVVKQDGRWRFEAFRRFSSSR